MSLNFDGLVGMAISCRKLASATACAETRQIAHSSVRSAGRKSRIGAKGTGNDPWPGRGRPPGLFPLGEHGCAAALQLVRADFQTDRATGDVNRYSIPFLYQPDYPAFSRLR